MTISSAAGASEITDDLAAENRPAPAPAAPPRRGGAWLRFRPGSWLGPRQVAAWYAVFALYAGGVAAFSGPGEDRIWGIWAAFGYAAAAGLAGAWPSRPGRAAALAAAVAAAVAAPVAWLATHASPTADVRVLTRSAALLQQHGTPYLPLAALAHGGWLAYNPYLPVMALFGLPHALGWSGLAGDPRPWLAVATVLILAAAFAAVGRGRGAALGLAAFATASPVLAFPLALGITDPPVIALTCLALALLTRPAAAHPAAAHPAAAHPAPAIPGRADDRPGLAHSRLWAAAIVLGVACAMKYTAWPALAILAVMLAARDGARTAARLAGIAVGTTAALSAALAPAALTAPAALIHNTVLFPLGLTKARSPAQSPLPGHLLAALGPGGHLAAIALLVTAGLAFAVALVTHPPTDTRAAALWLALGLALMFALSPATRFGYFAYPAGLCGWVALSRPSRQPPGAPFRRVLARPGWRPPGRWTGGREDHSDSAAA